MPTEHRERTLAVILHADIADSTVLVRRDETLAHERINKTFSRLTDTVHSFDGTVHEVRGDALVAEFSRASDAVSAALAFQQSHTASLLACDDKVVPVVRIGISLGEVVVADRTVTGAGVVLAQRVEQLAQPGGLCITAAIHEAVPDRLPFEQQSLGDQEIKGFEEPVRVYAVQLRDGAEAPEPEGPVDRSGSRRPVVLIAVVLALAIGSALAWLRPWQAAPWDRADTISDSSQPVRVQEEPTLPLPDRPSIAVLPFANMSDDPGQEYFVDGMADDLITDLSNISGLFVIARNSVFAYKGTTVSVKKVASDLGVQYVLEGSVRRVGNQVRINAQLIEANSEGHLWAERFDGTLDNVFALQDRVTKRIVDALSVRLTTNELAGSGGRQHVDPKAYDAYLRGWEHLQRRTPDQLAKALAFLEQSVALEPEFNKALAALAVLYWEVDRRQWYVALKVGSSAEAKRAADGYMQRALQNPTSLALVVSADRLMRKGSYEQALATARQALSLAPSSAEATIQTAEILVHAGQAEEALAFVVRAERLDPLNQAYYAYIRGMAYFSLENYDSAVTSLDRALALNPDFRRPAALLAATHGHLGQTQQALAARRAFAEEARQDGWGGSADRNEDIDDVRGITSTLLLFPFKDEPDRARLTEGLRLAGMPQQDTSYAWW